jgi:hypothetical protein
MLQFQTVVAIETLREWATNTFELWTEKIENKVSIFVLTNKTGNFE